MSKVSKGVGRRRGFRPTAGMRRYARVCAHAGEEVDELQRMARANVKARTLRSWRARDEFPDWLDREVADLRHRQAGLVWDAVLRKATEGDLRAAKLYLDRFDRKRQVQDEEMPRTFLDVALLAKKARENPPEMYWPDPERDSPVALAACGETDAG